MKLGQNKERFYTSNASGMHFAQKGKKACDLSHNRTPRLSMQIHSTLRTEKLTISTTCKKKKKAKTASRHALTLSKFYRQLPTLITSTIWNLQSCSNTVCTFFKQESCSLSLFHPNSDISASSQCCIDHAALVLFNWKLVQLLKRHFITMEVVLS